MRERKLICYVNNTTWRYAVKSNLTIRANGTIKIRLPKNKQVNIFDPEVSALMDLQNCHPFVMAAERQGRERLQRALNVKNYTINAEAERIIEEAIEEGASMATPIMPVTDFELSAYCDEFKTLVCKESRHGFEVGKRYRLSSYEYGYVDSFKRNKTHFGEKIYAKVHDCTLTGKDRAIRVHSARNYHDFLHRPQSNHPLHHPEAELWDVFERPAIRTVAERYPKRIEQNRKVLDILEAIAGFTYYPGQPDYLARLGCKSFAYIVAKAGTGKSNFALSLIGMKGANRSLIIAPQGTVKGEPEKEGAMSASQWAQEVEMFSPYMKVFELFSMDDYYKILRANRGRLPYGIYVTYFQAFFYNKSLERCPKSYTDGKLYQMVGTPLCYKKCLDTSQKLSISIGEERNGIRSIAKPSMATLIGDKFDMVCVDECHVAQTHNSLITQSIIRLQPKYRFAFSATPIPNDITNLFSMMGWLCVPDWYKGHRCNAAWPFAKEDISRFKKQFMSTERDITREKLEGKRFSKASPKLSCPTLLVKILKSTMAFIDKESCNPDYVRPEITDIRVPMGSQQTRLYSYYMDKTNVSGQSPGIKATNQVTALRSITAEPLTSRYNSGNAPRVYSQFNPKMVAILELVRDMIDRNEQVTIISARTSTSDMIERLLLQCGILCSRIDSKRKKHAKEAREFKAGLKPVMLMGIKCASAHSFAQCKNEIITSIEWGNGVFEQAVGRVDRINSPTPPNIYVILYKESIEEVMYDMVTIREEAATTCIQGHRVDNPITPKDIDEILAESIIQWKDNQLCRDEKVYELMWQDLRKDITAAHKRKTSKHSRMSNVQVAIAKL